MNRSEIDELLLNLAEYGDYLRVEAKSMRNPRWITPTPDGYRWLTPAEGRRKTVSEEDTLSMLSHYDDGEVVDMGDVPDDVRKLDQGLEAFTDGGQVGDGTDQELQQRVHFIHQLDQIQGLAGTAKGKVKTEDSREALTDLKELRGRLDSVIEDLQVFCDD